MLAVALLQTDIACACRVMMPILLPDVAALPLPAGLSDKDGAGPNRSFGGGSESSDGEDSEEEREAAVAAAVARKAHAGGGSVMAALQRAEDAQDSKKPKGECGFAVILFIQANEQLPLPAPAARRGLFR